MTWSINPYILFGTIGFIIPLIVKSLYHQVSNFLGIGQLSIQYLDALQIVFSLLIISGIVLATFRYVPEGYRALVERSDGSHRVLEAGVYLLNPLQEQVVFETSLHERFLNLGTQHFNTRDSIRLNMGVLVFWRVSELWQTYNSYKPEEQLKQRVINALYSEIGQRTAEEVRFLKPDIDALSLGIEVIRTELVNIQIVKSPEIATRNLEPSIAPKTENQSQFAVQNAKEIMEIAKLIYNPPISEKQSARILNYLLHRHFLTSHDITSMDGKSKITPGFFHEDNEPSHKKPG